MTRIRQCPTNCPTAAPPHMSKKTTQGHSWITPYKEQHLFGIVDTRLRMLQRPLRSRQTELPDTWPINLCVLDALCGTGVYTLNDIQKDGSPFTILAAFESNLNRLRVSRHNYELDGWLNFPVRFNFTDIRPDAIAELRDLIGKRKDGLFALPHIGQLISCKCMPASDALNKYSAWTKRKRNNRLLAFIDPNGIKDLPYKEISAILTDDVLRKRTDLVINISATAIKRVHGNEVAQRYMREWIASFSDLFVKALKADGSTWIREPISGDPFQWTMLAYWGGFAPGEWKAQNIVRLGSERGKRAVEFFTKKAA